MKLSQLILLLGLYSTFSFFPLLATDTENTGSVQPQVNHQRQQNAFWAKELRAAIGERIILTVPASRKIVLYRQDKPLQFQGYRGFVRPLKPKLHSGVLIPREKADISELLLSSKGNFTLLSLPLDAPLKLSPKASYELLNSRINGENYDLLNIQSNGQGILIVEMERFRRPGESGSYFKWYIKQVFLEQQ